MLNPIKKTNLCIFAIENAKRLNNFIDCDVIAEATRQLESIKEFQDNPNTQHSTIEAFDYLISAISYQTGGALKTKEYLAEYKTACL